LLQILQNQEIITLIKNGEESSENRLKQTIVLFTVSHS